MFGELKTLPVLFLNSICIFTGPFTVFAPSDKAFTKVPKEILDELAKNKDLLKEVLTYHVASGNVKSTDLSNDMLVETLEKDKVRVNIYGKVGRTKHTGSRP